MSAWCRAQTVTSTAPPAQASTGTRGTVFKVTPTGTLTTLYNFCSQTNCADGADPYAVLVQGTDGNFYGTTEVGGANNIGTVFKVTPAGTLTTLYSFCSQTNCADGEAPEGGLVQGNDGNFYGTTSEGGNSNSECTSGGGTCGTLFQITPGGTLTTIYSFCSQANCADGSGSIAGLFQGSDGNFYGTTAAGGITTSECAGCGTLFQITPGGAFTTVYSFCSLTNCADGDAPYAGLLQGSDGNLYGTTFFGGSTNNDGTVYELPLSPALPAPVQLALSSSTTVAGTPVTLTFNVLNAFSTTLQQCYAFVQNAATGAGNWTGIQTGALTSGVYTGTASITPTAPGTYTYALTCGGVESGFSGALTVTPAKGQLTLTSFTPNTSNIGAADTTLTLTGTGFNALDQVQVNGTSIATTFVSTTTLTAVVPAADFNVPAVLEISVFDPTAVASTQSLPLTVSAPPVNLIFSGPSTANSASQPELTFTLTNPYPVELTATFTLTFEGAEGVDDPNIVFANGTRTYSFNIPANVTGAPTVQLQSGTDAGNITITLSIALTANGQDVTPNVNPVVINIPTEAPVITSMTLIRSGDTITANIMGFSNTRDMTQAAFTFASYAAINNPNISVPETTLFGDWYSTTPSDAFGSEFLYTQAFTLNDDNSNISQITVTLTNSVGTSSSATAQ